QLTYFVATPCCTFFFHAPPPPALYTLSLHDALPISHFIDGTWRGKTATRHHRNHRPSNQHRLGSVPSEIRTMSTRPETFRAARLKYKLITMAKTHRLRIVVDIDHHSCSYTLPAQPPAVRPRTITLTS